MLHCNMFMAFWILNMIRCFVANYCIFKVHQLDGGKFSCMKGGGATVSRCRRLFHKSRIFLACCFDGWAILYH